MPSQLSRSSALLLLLCLAVVRPAPAQEAPLAALASAQARAQALGQALQLGDFSIQRLELIERSAESVQARVLLDGQSFTLDLFPWSVRSPEHFQVLAQVEGGAYVAVEAGPSSLWHGSLREAPGSRVSARFVDGGLDALIRVGERQPLWAIQPAWQVADGYGPGDHVVYASDDILAGTADCGGGLPGLGGATRPGVLGEADGFSGFADDAVCQIACDADVEYYQANGSSVSATKDDIELIVDRVQTIYQADASLLYEITTIIVRTVEGDPYSATLANNLLAEFQSHWNSSQASVVRDVAHLFTGKDLGSSTVGVAYLNTICDTSAAYGLSRSQYTANLALRTALTAHELGHNWWASHCDLLSDCGIMCSQIGACGSVQAFGQNAQQFIAFKKASVSCLDEPDLPPPPVISSVSSSSSHALGEALHVFGSELLYVDAATVDGQPLPDDQVQPIHAGEVLVIMPPAQALGPASLRLVSPGGTSNPISITYTAVTTPTLQEPGTIDTAVDTQAVWTLGAAPGTPCFLLVGLSLDTVPFKGHFLLDTPLPIVGVPTNAAGVGTLTIPVDPSLGGVGSYWVYSQAAFFLPPVHAVSSIQLTLVN